MHADHMNPEPSVEELLSDPVAVAVMNRDGITACDVLLLIEDMRHRLGLTDARARARQTTRGCVGRAA